jgi:tetratricopeptide (TPR) repeat protein
MTAARRGAPLLAVVALLAATAAWAADDVVARATRQYEQRHYRDAARTLETALPSLDPARQAAASLTLGVVYLGSAEVHRELARSALAIQLEYLKALAADRAPGASRMAAVYLGQTLLESGRPAEASKVLERAAAAAGLPPRVKLQARAYLGLAHFLLNDAATARAIWKSLDARDPQLKATLAAVYSRARIADPSPVALAEAALNDSDGLAPLVRQKVIGVYVRAGLTSRALALAEQTDLKAPTATEVLGPAKTINFYDPALLGELAALYRQASRLALERAAGHAQLKSTADYYLGAFFLEAGDAERALQATRAFLAVPGAPVAYRSRARVREAAARSLLARRGDDASVWAELSPDTAADPEVLADIVAACARYRLACAAVEPRAVRAAETGERRKTVALNFALGTYHLRKGDLPRAVAYLESARDKTNKNRIEANDPLLLVTLADAYYQTTQFSESLEIYFEMSRQFPVVRRLQEALQGVYAMTHKSAGDVKIF